MVYSTLFPRKDNNHQLTHGICTAWSAPTISKTKNLMLRYLSYKAKKKKNMKIIIINDESLMLMWENETTTTTAPLKKTTTTKTRKKRRKSRGDHRVCLRDRKITN